jgi:hypothetical protein
MSLQLESRHFYRAGDLVQHRRGDLGEVADAQTLYATIRWADGAMEEVDQFDPAIIVLERAKPA